MTQGDLVTSAFAEIRVARAGDVLSPDDMARGLYVLNRLLDFWNSTRRAVYAELFTDVTITPSLVPHTIGPGGTFAVTQRPESIDAASVNLGSGVYRPVTIRQKAWYAALTVPGLTSPFPTDLYYQTAWPLGQIYFWPVPTTPYGLRLWLRTVLASVAQTDAFSLPPGYQAAIELSLAEQLAPSYGQAVSPETKDQARKARAQVFGDNDDVPYLVTADAGLARGSATGFNWLDRSIV